MEWQYYEEQNTWAAFVTTTNEPSIVGTATLVLDNVEYTAEPLQGQFVFVDSSKNPVAEFNVIEENLWVLATGPYQPTSPHISIVQE